MQSIWTLTFSTRHNLDAAIITSFDERAPKLLKKTARHENLELNSFILECFWPHGPGNVIKSYNLFMPWHRKLQSGAHYTLKTNFISKQRLNYS